MREKYGTLLNTRTKIAKLKTHNQNSNVNPTHDRSIFLIMLQNKISPKSASTCKAFHWNYSQVPHRAEYHCYELIPSIIIRQQHYMTHPQQHEKGPHITESRSDKKLYPTSEVTHLCLELFTLRKSEFYMGRISLTWPDLSRLISTGKSCSSWPFPLYIVQTKKDRT